jgi:hypothetical protein
LGRSAVGLADHLVFALDATQNSGDGIKAVDGRILDGRTANERLVQPLLGLESQGIREPGEHNDDPVTGIRCLCYERGIVCGLA